LTEGKVVPAGLKAGVFQSKKSFPKKSLKNEFIVGKFGFLLINVLITI
jgi:hypothetical protein